MYFSKFVYIFPGLFLFSVFTLTSAVFSNLKIKMERKFIYVLMKMETKVYATLNRTKITLKFYLFLAG